MTYFICRRRDLNPHGSLHTPLKRARLPFRHYDTIKKSIQFSSFILTLKRFLHVYPSHETILNRFVRQSATTTQLKNLFNFQLHHYILQKTNFFVHSNKNFDFSIYNK